MTQLPLRLTPEQVEFIRPLLDMERDGNRQPNMIFAQVRRTPYPDNDAYEIAFCLCDYSTAGKVLHTIEMSRATHYAPHGSQANFVELLPTGEPVFVVKKTKGPSRPRHAKLMKKEKKQLPPIKL